MTVDKRRLKDYSLRVEEMSASLLAKYRDAQNKTNQIELITKPKTSRHRD
ncbi:hypothetical protein LC613_41320 [Nostoc sphaeroides CHAB 2801]|nr:hypothetical protein [Nostoc sphaeroides]MCC5633860.1 hypothetical protein [Nostoc sphaeroides CHAB 2801]